MDDKGFYVGNVTAVSSGNDRKESAWADMTRATGRIEVRYSIDQRCTKGPFAGKSALRGVPPFFLNEPSVKSLTFS